MSGQKLLEMVRAAPLLQNIPFIMVTAESHQAIVTAAKDAGANHYLVKPFYR